MPAGQQNVYAGFAAAGGSPASAAETVIATTRAISSPYDGSSFLVEFVGQITPGTSTTAVTYKIRRDSVSGTTVATTPALGATAAVPATFAVSAVDSPAGSVSGQLWVLTATQTAGAANGATANVTTKVTTPV